MDNCNEKKYDGRYDVIEPLQSLDTSHQEIRRVYEKALGVKLRPISCQDLNRLTSE
jgi:L-rhamnose isomerase